MDFNGKAGAEKFKTSGPIGSNTGAVIGITVIAMVIGSVPWLLVGLKVYSKMPVDDVLIVEGVHVPVILFFEVSGSLGAVEP